MRYVHHRHNDHSNLVRHPVFARFDTWLARAQEARGVQAHRRELLAGTKGRAIEIGPGPGLSFCCFPSEVTSVLAVEPEPYMRRQARRAAASATVPVHVVDGCAQELPADDASFDVAVVSLVLCSVSDQLAALREIRRVLRPGGEVRFYEHVRSTSRSLGAAQAALDLVWPHVAGGCHTGRDTAAAIERAGFLDVRYRRLTYRSCLLLAPMSSRIIGSASRA